MTLVGKAWKFGDHVDTDAIIPARYLNRSTEGELAAHCMEDIDAAFAGAVQPGDMILAGINFGCGSSREYAPRALQKCGIAAIIAPSFARIFFRNIFSNVEILNRTTKTNRKFGHIKKRQRFNTTFTRKHCFPRLGST